MSFIGRTAQAKYNADVWHLGLGLTRSFVHGDTSFTPGVNLDWRQIEVDAYTESGAGALGLATQAQKAQEAILKFGAQVQHDADHQLQWLAHAALGYDLQSGDHAVTAQFTGGGAAFTTPGLPRARTVAELGVGMRYKPSEAMAVTARYDIALRKGLRDQTASVRLGWVF
jgi:outer membrane autotransporter protein